MVREQRRIISAATGLTGSGSPGGPGVSAPSLALGRMGFLGKNLVSVNAIPLNTGERIVITPGIKRLSPVVETATVPWTASGIVGVIGDIVVVNVVQEKELELDSVADLGMEDRIVMERQKKRSRATLMIVLE